MADYDIFREQLAIRYPTYGHALWGPGPRNPDQPVQVGDVGFIRRGKFYRFFNALLPADDPSHQELGVPEYHEPLVPHLSNHIGTDSLDRNNYYSAGVSVEPDTGYWNENPDDSMFRRVSFRHNKTPSRGAAVLSLPATARREDTLAMEDFRWWIVTHIDSWFAFVQKLRLGIEHMEEIVLVTGCDLARSWTNIAFLGGQGHQVDSQVSFGVKVEDTSPNSSINFRYSPENAQGAVLRCGPEGTDLPENQSVFIRGFRVARSFWILPRRLKAAAGPPPDTGGHDYDTDKEVIPISAISKYRDPLHLLLEYISEQASDCDIVLAHDNDLVTIAGFGHDTSLETLEPDVMMDLLQASNIEIHKVSCVASTPKDLFRTDSGPNADASVVKVAMLPIKLQNRSGPSYRRDEMLGRQLTLLSVPNDTLVDLILIRLCVRDILRLRSVCRLFYELTHQPIVWKRILRTFHIPLPPLPPTIRSSFPSLSSLETERLVIRALAAEANWRSTMPKSYKAWRFCVYADVMSLKIVPGGKYVVASIREGENRYALMLLMMEQRLKTAYPVAKMATASKAYKLEAKYMRYGGEMGIMISYVRCEPKRAADRMAGVDVSDYSEDHVIDSPVPVRCELNVLHCPFSALHVAEDPRFPPGSSAYTAPIDTQSPPFRSVTIIRSNTAFDFTDLEVLDGTPYVIAVQERLILFKNLLSRDVHRIRVGPLFGYEEEASENHPDGNLTYDIRAIRTLALQRELLVVRTDQKNVSKPLALELYKIPDDSIPLEAQEVQVAWPRSVHIVATPSPPIHVSISAVPSSTDGEDAVAVLMAHAEPPPVSVFVVMRDPWQIVQFRLWPERVPKVEVGHFPPDGKWQEEIQAAVIAAAAAGAVEEEGEVAESLEDGSEDGSDDDMAVDVPTPPTTTQEDNPPSPRVPLKDTTFRFQLYGPFFKIISYTYQADPALGLLRILPGTTRPLLMGIQAGDRRATPSLHDLWAYADLIAPPAPSPRWPEDEERRAAGEAERGWIDATLKSRASPAALAQLALPPGPIREKFTRGVVAMEWDDWSMSMCGVCKDEPNMIYLFQFAPTPTEKQDGHRFPIPVSDVDERFREIPQKDPFGISGIIP